LRFSEAFPELWELVLIAKCYSCKGMADIVSILRPSLAAVLLLFAVMVLLVLIVG